MHGTHTVHTCSRILISVYTIALRAASIIAARRELRHRAKFLQQSTDRSIGDRAFRLPQQIDEALTHESYDTLRTCDRDRKNV